MEAAAYQQIRDSLRQLYVDDPRPWLFGLSVGKDSTMVASLVVDAGLAVPPGARKNPVIILCTDSRVLYKLYASASDGECPIQIEASTSSCGNSRFGCWTCTVFEKDKVFSLWN